MKGLHVHGVSHAFDGHQVLDNVSLTIPAGELVCLLGPSGCGKTTLLRIAAGLERLQHGGIIIDETVVAAPDTHVAPEHRGIGLMFQDYALFPHLTILRNATFGLARPKSAGARRRALEMLDQVGMAAYADKYPHMLSGGQQQRVALARALAPEPRLLLLDEPFSGLEVNLRMQIREETVAVLKRTGVATLMVTHDPEEAMFMADRIKIIGANGRILQAGRPHEIYYHPNHEFVANLFGMMNRFECRVSKGRVETPLGSVATDLQEGLAVQVLIRPEGVILESNGDATGAQVEVTSSHLLGHDNIIRVRFNNGEGEELYVRVHHTFEAELKKSFTARIDHEYAFVYPLNEEGGNTMAMSPQSTGEESKATAAE